LILENVFSRVEENSEKYVRFLADICAFEATARDKETLDALVDFITDFVSGEGFSTRRVPFEECGDFLVVEMNADAAEKGAVLLAHLDTVHEKGRFGTPAVRVEGDRMIGPGVIDCKGGVAIALLAMLALKAEGYPGHVKLLLTTDEEISNVLGGEREQQFFRDEVAGFPMALNCEVASTGEITTSRKGILRYEVTVKGRGGHAGISYFESVNPVLEAAHKIVALQQGSVQGGTTYSCNVIEAGSVSNVIPDTCLFTVDVRVCTHADVAAADARVREICQKSFIGDTSAQVLRLGMRPPMEPSAATDALFARLAAIGREYGLEELTPVASGGGSDSAYTQAAGVTSLCGLGGCGAFCHTDREYIEIPGVPRRAKLLAALLAKGE
jgi:glutamate carboxypeptidase